LGPKPETLWGTLYSNPSGIDIVIGDWYSNPSGIDIVIGDWYSNPSGIDIVIGIGIVIHLELPCIPMPTGHGHMQC
jgi:hypothetical protein